MARVAVATVVLALALLFPASAIGKRAKDEVVVYAGSSSGYVYAFDGADGKEIWKLRLHARVLGSPVLRADRLYVVTSDTLGGA
ncbi:MAG: outer membrane protein assembly factor BamB family protein, partial [Planctomycetota bacterium]